MCCVGLVCGGGCLQFWRDFGDDICGAKIINKVCSLTMHNTYYQIFIIQNKAKPFLFSLFLTFQNFTCLVLILFSLTTKKYTISFTNNNRINLCFTEGLLYKIKLQLIYYNIYNFIKRLHTSSMYFRLCKLKLFSTKTVSNVSKYLYS